MFYTASFKSYFTDRNVLHEDKIMEKKHCRSSCRLKLKIMVAIQSITIIMQYYHIILNKANNQNLKATIYD